jgi:hypothetical protein
MTFRLNGPGGRRVWALMSRTRESPAPQSCTAATRKNADKDAGIAG